VEGPHEVRESSATVEIEGRSPLRVDLYLPGPAEGSPGPFPVVIYSHGFQLTGSQYASVGRRLASHGLVTVLPTYGDGVFSPRAHSDLAEDVRGLVDWVASEAARAGSDLHGVADPTRLGAGGHSRGGKQSILAATRDERILASFNVDPVDSVPPGTSPDEDNPSVAPELLGEFRIPGGFVGAGRSASGSFGACAPEEESFRQFFEGVSSPAFEYFLEDAGHLDFVDRCGLLCLTCAAGAEPAWAHGFATTTMTAFYRVFLAEDERYRPWVDGPPVRDLADRVVLTTR
jgi:predicted dienelactone hydrolase